MYTFKDLVADKFTLVNEVNLIDIDGVKSISVSRNDNGKKIVKIHLGFIGYMFETTFQNALKAKVEKDLSESAKFEFGI